MKALYAIVGMKHRKTEDVVAALKKGHPLLLIREPDNEHDSNAVQVWANDIHIGFVKGTQAAGLARRLDAPTWRQTSAKTGQRCVNAVLQVDGGRWPMAEVDE